jgi:hypothetical protein
MLPISLSLLESSIPIIVPFIVKPRFLNAVLIGNIILYGISLLFLLFFEIFFYETCIYAQNFLKAFLILASCIVLLCLAFLGKYYYKVKKTVKAKYNKEINDLYDLDERPEIIHPKKKIKVKGKALFS